MRAEGGITHSRHNLKLGHYLPAITVEADVPVVEHTHSTVSPYLTPLSEHY